MDPLPPPKRSDRDFKTREKSPGLGHLNERNGAPAVTAGLGFRSVAAGDELAELVPEAGRVKVQGKGVKEARERRFRAGAKDAFRNPLDSLVGNRPQLLQVAGSALTTQTATC